MLNICIKCKQVTPPSSAPSFAEILYIFDSIVYRLKYFSVNNSLNSKQTMNFFEHRMQQGDPEVVHWWQARRSCLVMPGLWAAALRRRSAFLSSVQQDQEETLFVVTSCLPPLKSTAWTRQKKKEQGTQPRLPQGDPKRGSHNNNDRCAAPGSPTAFSIVHGSIKSGKWTFMYDAYAALSENAVVNG